MTMDEKEKTVTNTNLGNGFPEPEKDEYKDQTLNWAVGLVLLSMGVAMLTDSSPTSVALFCILGSLFFLPPAKNLLYSKTKIRLSTSVKASCGFALIVSTFVAGGFEMHLKESMKLTEQREIQVEQKKKMTQMAMQNEKKLDHFTVKKEAILESVTDAIEVKEYQSAIVESEMYLLAKDKDLAELNRIAKEGLALSKFYDNYKENTQALIAEWKSLVDAKDYETVQGNMKKLVQHGLDKSDADALLDLNQRIQSRIAADIEERKKAEELLAKQEEIDKNCKKDWRQCKGASFIRIIKKDTLEDTQVDEELNEKACAHVWDEFSTRYNEEKILIDKYVSIRRTLASNGINGKDHPTYIEALEYYESVNRKNEKWRDQKPIWNCVEKAAISRNICVMVNGLNCTESHRSVASN